MQRTILALLLLFVVAGSALADDRQPATWRYQDRTTYQRWEFWQGNPAGVPDDYDNDYGVANLTAAPTYIPQIDTRSGVWSVGDIWVHIPNVPDHPEYVKTIWLQLTWESAVATNRVLPLVEAGPTQSGPMYAGDFIETDVLFAPTRWEHTIWQITMPSNPECEWVHISGNILVDELVIDTKCAPVPEPMTLVLSVLGLATVGGFRRLRK